MGRTPQLLLPSEPTKARVRVEGLGAVEAEVVARQVEAARAEGYARGRRDAELQAARALENAAERLDEARERAETALPREVLELAVEVADQLLKVRVAEGDYDIERIVRSALAGGGVDRGRCIVHLHPADLESLEGVPFRSDTELSAHTDLPRGTVHVDTPRGLLVRDPAEALEQIRESVLEGLV